MAVIAKYIVIRDGVELGQVFTDRKEAEAYDNLLDAAQQIVELIKQGDLRINVDAKTMDDIAVFLAKNAPAVTKILKAVKPIKPESSDIDKSNVKTGSAEDKDKAQELRAKSRNKAA